MTGMKPLVTIYIANYNYAKYISDAVASVAKQSYKNIQTLIIDDGSKDHSKSVITELSKKYIFESIFQKNIGLNATNNVALANAKGKYIMRLDADDYLAPKAIELLVEKIESDSELGLVFPDYYYVDGEGSIIAKQIRHDFDKDVLLHDQAAHGACTLIRTDFLKQVGGYDEDFSCQDGYELWVKFIKNFKVSNLNLPLFYYRQHGKNLTSNENRILSTRAAINQKAVDKLNLDTSTLAIIPVKDESSIAFLQLNNKSLLEVKIEQALNTNSIIQIVIATAVSDLADRISNRGILDNPKISVYERKNAEINDLNAAISSIIEARKNGIKSICTLAPEYPFAGELVIQDAINTMYLFGSNSILSVHANSSNFYIHEGGGLIPILNREQKTKIEREAIYKQVGGITVVRTKPFVENRSTLNRPIGHVMVSQKAGFEIRNTDSLKWAQSISMIVA